MTSDPFADVRARLAAYDAVKDGTEYDEYQDAVNARADIEDNAVEDLCGLLDVVDRVTASLAELDPHCARVVREAIGGEG